MDVIAPDVSAEAASLLEEVSESVSQAVRRPLAGTPSGSVASVSRLTSAAALPHFKTPIFEGPLDLLLHLIRINEVDIYDIPIAEITGQYLAYMELLEELDLAVAGEYVVMAATLIEIKSRMLLPQPPAAEGQEEAEDPRAELVARLLEYQQYQGVVETLRTWEELRRQVFFRGALENADDYILPVPEGEATAQQLVRALQRLLDEAGVTEKAITAVTPRRRLSLRLKMAEIARKIAANPEGLAFETLFTLPCPRYDIVLTFLALLELLRSGRVRAQQKQTCGPIWLKPENDAL
ncbi:MAG TPA: segregation/condensation protein A [Chthonomonadaceae bacterium]|nr:segregation/condensation protein A [Chthonomonadaceae bacterium]